MATTKKTKRLKDATLDKVSAGLTIDPRARRKVKPTKIKRTGEAAWARKTRAKSVKRLARAPKRRGGSGRKRGKVSMGKLFG